MRGDPAFAGQPFEVERPGHPGTERFERPPHRVRPPEPRAKRRRMTGIGRAKQTHRAPIRGSLLRPSGCREASRLRPRPRRRSQKNVKMVRHDAVGEHPAAGELLGHPHQCAELLLFLAAKSQATFHDPRNHVVNHRILFRILPRGGPSRSCHAPVYARPGTGAILFLFMACPDILMACPDILGLVRTRRGAGTSGMRRGA